MAIKVTDKEKRYCLDVVPRWRYPENDNWKINASFIKNLKKENRKARRRSSNNKFNKNE